MNQKQNKKMAEADMEAKMIRNNIKRHEERERLRKLWLDRELKHADAVNQLSIVNKTVRAPEKPHF